MKNSAIKIRCGNLAELRRPFPRSEAASSCSKRPGVQGYLPRVHAHIPQRRARRPKTHIQQAVTIRRLRPWTPAHLPAANKPECIFPSDPTHVLNETWINQMGCRVISIPKRLNWRMAAGAFRSFGAVDGSIIRHIAIHLAARWVVTIFARHSR
jgi:hypothetical protein